MRPDTKYWVIAACMAHVEGYYSIKSQAYRSKNPGNIEVIGKAIFREFPTILEGWEALYYDIVANKGKTLAQFLSKYAPPSENNTSMYLQVVSTLSGVAPDSIL